MKRVFGKFELAFDIYYLGYGAWIAIQCLSSINSMRQMAGIMAVVLILGDSFHLVPRMMSIACPSEKVMDKALGFGKLITSITMTVFYLILWLLALNFANGTIPTSITYLLYGLAILRIALCLFPQNKWFDRYPPVRWGMYRNIPFVFMGIIVAWGYAFHVTAMAFIWMPWAIFLSFAFYLPVVLWANQKPMVGMLMLPKSCVYLWILTMFLAL